MKKNLNNLKFKLSEKIFKSNFGFIEENSKKFLESKHL